MYLHRVQTSWIVRSLLICLVFQHQINDARSLRYFCLCKPSLSESSEENLANPPRCIIKKSVNNSQCYLLERRQPPNLQKIYWNYSTGGARYNWKYDLRVIATNQTDKERVANLFLTLYTINASNLKQGFPVRGCINISLSEQKCIPKHCTDNREMQIFIQEKNYHWLHTTKFLQKCESKYCHGSTQTRYDNNDTLTSFEEYLNDHNKKIQEEGMKNNASCVFYFNKEEVKNLTNGTLNSRYSNALWFNRDVYKLSSDKFQAFKSVQYENYVLDRYTCDIYLCNSFQQALNNNISALLKHTFNRVKNKLVCLPWKDSSGTNITLCMEPTTRNEQAMTTQPDAYQQPSLVLIITLSVLGIVILLTIVVCFFIFYTHALKKRIKRLKGMEAIKVNANLAGLKQLDCVSESEEGIDVFKKDVANLRTHRSNYLHDNTRKAFDAEMLSSDTKDTKNQYGVQNNVIAENATVNRFTGHDSSDSESEEELQHSKETDSDFEYRINSSYVSKN